MRNLHDLLSDSQSELYKRERHGERFNPSPRIETIKLLKKREVKSYDKIEN